MVTEHDIISGLSRLGITRGDEVEVHASLGGFGTVDGGAETVILVDRDKSAMGIIAICSASDPTC